MDEKFLEQASDLAQARRDDALKAAHNSLQGKGRAKCLDCKEPIPRERRKALPNAIRCIACASTFETRNFTLKGKRS